MNGRLSVASLLAHMLLLPALAVPAISAEGHSTMIELFPPSWHQAAGVLGCLLNCICFPGVCPLRSILPPPQSACSPHVSQFGRPALEAYLIWRLQTGPVTADAYSHLSFSWRLRWPLTLLDRRLPLRCGAVLCCRSKSCRNDRHEDTQRLGAILRCHLELPCTRDMIGQRRNP